MQTLRSFLQSIAVMLLGAIVVTMLVFTSGFFGGSGKQALTVYAETPEEKIPQEESQKTDEIKLVTDAKMQFRLTDIEEIKAGQQLVGSTLIEGIQAVQSVRQEQQAVIEENKEETRLIEEERARIVAEEAARVAEEARIQKEAEARKAASIISYSDKDYEVLQKIVQAEAGICDTKGRILVANVIMNRVRSNEFPDSISEVVFQRSQFSPIQDGRFYSCEVESETIEAVNRALSGEDYSQGALYFMNRKRSRASNVSWFDGSLTYLFHHDRHDFFK